MILYNILIDLESDRARKTSCLTGNKYNFPPIQKSRNFSFQRYEKADMRHFHLTLIQHNCVDNHD